METKIFLSILLITCYCMVARGQMSDCCLSTSNKEIPRGRVVDYSHQIRGMGCSIDATILVTRNGRKLCVPLKGDWLLLVKNYVDNLKAYCKKVNYKAKRCPVVNSK
ncbi:unnamed protein product [Ophioblennius macclurei]